MKRDLDPAEAIHGSVDNGGSHDIEDCDVLEFSDEALEAAADSMRIALSLSSIGIVAPNCC